MPILEIEGLGRVEVDPSFLDKSPAEQEAIVAEITASARSAPKRQRGPATRNITVTFDDGTKHVFQNAPGDITPQQVVERAERESGKTVAHLDGGRAAAPTNAAAPAPASEIVDTAQAAFDNAAVQPSGSAPQFSDEWLAEQERQFQQSREAQGYPPKPADDLPRTDQTSAVEAGALGLVDGVAFGFADELGAVADSLLGGNKRTIWDGTSFADAYSANVAANRERLEAAQDEHPIAYGVGGVGGAFVPIAGNLGGIAKTVSAASKLKSAAKTGAVYGALYGAGSDEGMPLDRLDGAAVGAGVGAVGGAAVHGAAKAAEATVAPIVRKVLPKLEQSYFNDIQAKNPHAITDAKVAADLKKVVDGLLVNSARRKLDKGRQASLLSRVDDLEQSYLPFDEIAGMDLPPSAKARLRLAMTKRHLLDDGEVQALRDGSPEGEAVAEGIAKARRLRAYVSDAAGSSGVGSSVLAEAFGSAAGWKLGGPIGGAVGGRIGRAVVRPDSKAAKDAMELADKSRLFANVPEVAEALANSKAHSLTRVSDDALDASYNTARDTVRLEAEGRKVAIANARDDVRPSGGWRGLIYERTGLLPSQQDAGALTALKDGAISPEQFKAHLDNPNSLMAGNAGNALIDRLAAMADDGRLTRDAKWEPPKATAGKATAQAAFEAADQRWRTALEADAVEFDATGADRLHRPTAAAVSSAYAEREAAQRTLDGAGIHNPLAYSATAGANQQRVSDALSDARSREGLADADRETIATAIARIGNTSSRADAQAIATDALDRLGDDQRGYARSLLSPLVEQIRR